MAYRYQGFADVSERSQDLLGPRKDMENMPYICHNIVIAYRRRDCGPWVFKDIWKTRPKYL